ncbi:MAG: 2-C-methyl-D-erythritol 4-phosphate cytidylyltransferase [Candidatus Omnitrophota bacterium]
MIHCSAIVLAAGRGRRFNSSTPKPLVKINSKPIIVYSLETLSKNPYIKDIIVVVNPKNKKQIIEKIKQFGILKVKKIILGGRQRQDSVRNGLKALGCNCNLVLIHDAARPFIREKDLSAVIKLAKNKGAAILGVPVKATIKAASCRRHVSGPGKVVVAKTLNRENLWEIQTPQVFKKDLILQAYKKFGRSHVTDDAMLLEKLGRKVYLVCGCYNNIKITTPEDIIIARAIQRG